MLDRDQRRLVENLSLLLRLAVAMDRRPEASIASFEAHFEAKNLQLSLVPLDPNDDLSLELWSLDSCAKAFQDACGISLGCGLAKALDSRQGPPLAV